MKALLSVRPGGPDSLDLQEVPSPQPQTGEVVVSVRACAINYPDVLIIEDRYQARPPRPFAPGGEVAGIVKQVGTGVTGFAPGERVIASMLSGGLAQEVAVPQDKVHRIPDAMPFEEAAAFIVAFGTAYHALCDRGQLQSDETLLVLGAAGGVGLAAVQLGAALGARVVAAASSDAKLALAKSCGAHVGLVYGVSPFDGETRKRTVAAFKSACGESGADVILDIVGGDYTEAALRSIAWQGRFLVVGFPAGIPRIPLNLVLLKGCQVAGVFYGASAERDPAQFQRGLQTLFALYNASKIRPHISERLPLERGGEAIKRLAQREALGKIVVML
jgi:NADPH2:quinone reductase